MAKLLSIFGDRDPLEVPLYTVQQAAGYLGVASSTVRTWVAGMDYPVAQKRQGRFKELIDVSPEKPTRLTFNNLIEAYVLTTLRRQHKVPLSAVRNAIANVRTELGDPRPLLSQDFVTDGARIYLEHVAGLQDVSTKGGKQLAMREVLKGLKRIERDPRGIAMRLFPYLDNPDEPQVISIDPRFSFGRPTIKDSRVQVEVVADLVNAGETVERVAKEFGVGAAAVRQAVAWHERAAA